VALGSPQGYSTPDHQRQQLPHVFVCPGPLDAAAAIAVAAAVAGSGADSGEGGWHSLVAGQGGACPAVGGAHSGGWQPGCCAAAIAASEMGA